MNDTKQNEPSKNSQDKNLKIVAWTAVALIILVLLLTRKPSTPAGIQPGEFKRPSLPANWDSLVNPPVDSNKVFKTQKP